MNNPMERTIRLAMTAPITAALVAQAVAEPPVAGSGMPQAWTVREVMERLGATIGADISAGTYDGNDGLSYCTNHLAQCYRRR